MDWLQVFTLFLANASLIIWFRTESRNDYKHAENKMEAFNKRSLELIEAINKEMKDFHGRLCAIEERRNK